VERQDGPRYILTVDLGKDPVTGDRRQRRFTYRTKREAERARTEKLAEIDRGSLVDRSNQTIGELLDFWLETYARPRVRAKSYETYERIIRVHLKPGLGTIRVQALKPEHLQQFYADKLAAGCGKRTVEMCHMRLAQALKMAVEHGQVARNVALVVKPPRARAREMQTWSRDEAHRFLQAASGSSYGPIWAVALATGMRRGELLGLRWCDIDGERRIIHVRQAAIAVGGEMLIGPTKGDRSRAIHGLPPSILAALREHKARQNAQRLQVGSLWQDHDLVFCSAVGTPIYGQNLAREYDRLVKLAGVPRIRIHDQRHTNATLLLADGWDPKLVGERLGHRDVTTTLRTYYHVAQKQHEEAGDRLGALLFGPAEGAS
jgi:integrase